MQRSADMGVDRAHWSVLHTCLTCGRASVGSVSLVDTFFHQFISEVVVAVAQLVHLVLKRGEKGPSTVIILYVVCRWKSEIHNPARPPRD